MALDEALLESAGADGIATFRLYRWSQPTLSLGYFQSFDERRLHAASRDCPMVRRASGGGAILHDAELTYSLSLPTADRLAAAARGLCDSVHTALCEALGSLDVAVRIGEGSPAGSRPPFLCFERHGRGDLMLGGAKIAGSAQRRHRGAILQHGSVLLARSPHAPELPGAAELTGRQIDPRELAERFRERLCSRIGLQCTAIPLAWQTVPDRIQRRAEAILQEKFATGAWNYRR